MENTTHFYLKRLTEWLWMTYVDVRIKISNCYLILHHSVVKIFVIILFCYYLLLYIRFLLLVVAHQSY